MTKSSISQSFQGYRADIDGLRAVAVLAVILYHIDKTLIPGGFVGVDIFFVISGYLISLHIFKDLNKKSFSLVEFYRRRIKRIVPAMLVVIAITLILTQLIFRPEDAEKVAESSLWSLLSLANVYFWLYQDTSYFAAASSELPLLHLWSLGVEEQFYLFWPLILMLLYRIKQEKYFLVLSVCVAVFSFLLAEYMYNNAPSFVYYMLPTRAGELLIGAISTHIVMRHGAIEINLKVVQFLAVTGFVLILGSLVLLSEDNVFPGFRAIPPTIGAALLILSGHYGRSWAAYVLQLKPMVWVGVISYSAYLWHWPILAFYRYSQPEMTVFSGTVIFLSTMILGWISYLYIECPTRRSLGSAYKIFTQYFIIPVGILAFVSLVSMKLDGYGIRWFSDEYKFRLNVLNEETRPAYKYDYVCQRQLITKNDIDDKRCVIGGDSKEQTRTILWGDSNAAHYIGMLGEFSRELNFSFMNLEVGSCPPIKSDPASFVGAKRLSDCRKSNELILQNIEQFKVVIISSNWSNYQSKSDDFIAVFFDTVKELVSSGKMVILIGKAPVISTYDRLCREKLLSFPYMNCNINSVSLSKDVADVNRSLKLFADNTKNVEYYDINNYLCPNNECSAFNKSGKVIYYDTSHLTLNASWNIGSEIINKEGAPFPFTLIKHWSSSEPLLLNL
ncbi:MAG: acyltransferase family protein [Pseudomonadota bacterium]